MSHPLRILERFSADVLLAIVLAVALGIFPMTWWFKTLLLLLLAFILVELTWRLPLARGWKPLAAILVVLAMAAIGRGPVSDQYNTDAVLRDYTVTRDLVAKFQDREVSLKRIVAQYD